MTTKRRMTVSLVSLVATLLLAVVSVVGVWAALVHTTETTVNVTYKAREVMADVELFTKIEGAEFQDTAVASKSFDGLNDTVNTDAETNALGTVTEKLGRFKDGTEVKPGEGDEFIHSVVLKFVITNTSGADGNDSDVPFDAVLKFEAGADNKNVTVKAGTTEAGATTEIPAEGYKVSLTKNSNAEIYVVIELDKVNEDALCAGTFELTLTSTATTVAAA